MEPTAQYAWSELVTRIGSWGRAYFAVQALAGLAWWVAVFTLPAVRWATLGGLDPVAVALWDLPLFVLGSALAACGLRVAAVVSTGWTAVVFVGLGAYATTTTEAGWGVLAMAAATAGSVLALCAFLLGRLPTEWITRGPFAFRPAPPRASPAAHVLLTAAQLVFFWGLFLVVFPAAILWCEHRWGVGFQLGQLATPLGVALLIPASALGLWSAAVMSVRGEGTPLPSAMPNRLVIAGPYRWVRNPMAVAGVCQCLGVGLVTQSWLVIAYALVGAVVWNVAVRPSEEADLSRRFGPAFDRYRDEVRCWVPRIPRVPRRSLRTTPGAEFPRSGRLGGDGRN